MRPLVRGLTVLLFAATAAGAQSPPAGQPPQPGMPQKADGKSNANPCRDEVAAALKKLRSSSWFRMNTSMITESGPVMMEIDYVLPDRMHQKVTQKLTSQTSQIILVGDEAWGTDGQGWQALGNDLMNQLKTQLYDNVIAEQADVGNYACKGKAQIEGREALTYKLEDEPPKESTAPKNQTYRMFYVDAVTGLPLGNALLAPGREQAPLFKASYSYPVDLKIEPPKDVVKPPAQAPAPGK
jgi:hypothetical protein